MKEACCNAPENMFRFLMKNRDVMNLAEDPVGTYPHYEFRLEMEPNFPKVLYTQQYKQPQIYQEEIKKWTERQLREELIEHFERVSMEIIGPLPRLHKGIGTYI